MGQPTTPAQPIWVIEADVFGEATEPLKAELRKHGIQFVVASTHPLTRSSAVSGVPYPGDPACVVFYGSFPTMRHIQLHTKWSPGGWCSFDALACHCYYAYFGRYLLNQKYVILPGVEAIRKADWLYEVLGKNDQVFVRPSQCQKTIVGRLVFSKEFADALAPTRYDPTTLVVVAEPREVGREWRLVVAEGKVLAASQYCEWGMKAFKKGCPPAVQTFAERTLREVGWEPDDVYMMDVCESDNKLWLQEFNAFSCSGLYACDLGKVVPAVTAVAQQRWLELHPVRANP